MVTREKVKTTSPVDVGTLPLAGSVVVGFDASPGGDRALAWAQRHTGGIGSLVVVGCWDRPWWDVASLIRRERVDPVVEQLRAAVADGDARAHAVIRRGPAGPTLVEVSSGAGLLVVGSRGRGVIAGSILGSTSTHCAHHATVPVAIVPTAADPDARIDEVAVGVDGSASSIAALRWALRFAPAGAVIDIHFAWMTEPLARTLTSAELERVRSASAGFLDAVVDRVVAEENAWTRTTRRHLAIGTPSAVLDTAGASMVVVGTRSQHGLEAMVLGSSADALARSAHAVLVLVPPPPESNEGGGHVG